jgi:hypothetical protein
MAFVNALEVTLGIALLPLFLKKELKARFSIFQFLRTECLAIFATFLQSTGYLSVAFIL